MSDRQVLGVFDDAGRAAAAASVLRRDGVGTVTVYAPALNSAIDDALGPGRSPVRVFTLVGGILGVVIGFGLPIYTVLDWPLITGGKPVLSMPPFVIIAFELTILCAALATAAGFLRHSRLPRLRGAEPAYDPRFSDDRWGVVVTCGAGADPDAARAHLRQSGATEVRETDAR